VCHVLVGNILDVVTIIFSIPSANGSFDLISCDDGVMTSRTLLVETELSLV